MCTFIAHTSPGQVSPGEGAWSVFIQREYGGWPLIWNVVPKVRGVALYQGMALSRVLAVEMVGSGQPPRVWNTPGPVCRAPSPVLTKKPALWSLQEFCTPPILMGNTMDTRFVGTKKCPNNYAPGGEAAVLQFYTCKLTFGGVWVSVQVSRDLNLGSEL